MARWILKWICGYANAYGGILYIGKNDDGVIVGISDKDRKNCWNLFKNKITDIMGIVVDVNLLYENNLQYMEITVDKYPSLISYHGKYFLLFWQYDENDNRKGTG